MNVLSAHQKILAADALREVRVPGADILYTYNKAYKVLFNIWKEMTTSKSFPGAYVSLNKEDQEIANNLKTASRYLLGKSLSEEKRKMIPMFDFPVKRIQQ